MLKFFRTYQQYFFIIITVVIVISFSFFGTYDSLPMGAAHNETAFVALDGKPVTRADLNSMMLFLSTDGQDKLNWGGAWGPNFLNDGVLVKDLMAAGLAQSVGHFYADQLQSDLTTRLAKEQRYTPYTHPQAKFISVMNAWNFVAPQMRTQFDSLRGQKDATSDEALQARIALYSGSKQLSPALLKRVLRYQEQQYDWVSPDPNLDYTDISLFNYRTFEDWFGSRFLSLLSQFVINGAHEAESRGYEVTRKEALADLLSNAEKSFTSFGGDRRLGVANVGEYFDEQLRRMNMDRNTAVKVWQQVLLFRRLFNDVGGAVFVDPLMFEEFNAFAKQEVFGDLFQLQKPLRFENYEQLQKFELYLDAISERGASSDELLMLPIAFKSIETVSKETPELVQKMYQLQVAQTTQEIVEQKISLKETWNWEVDDKNWKSIAKEFPELGMNPSTTRDDRFASLDALDPTTRSRLDAFARKQLILAHPEWISESMEENVSQEMRLGLSKRGGKSPLPGVKKGGDLIPLLDDAPIGEISEALSLYTPDEQHYYRIAVVEKRAEGPHILTFAEADDSGVLKDLLSRKLQAAYLDIRKDHPETFKKGDGSWKEFSQVQDQVADVYFKPLLDAIKTEYAKSHDEVPSNWSGQQATPYRFFPYMEKLRNAFVADEDLIDQHILGIEQEALKGDRVTNLSEQWKLVQNPYSVQRSQAQRLFEPEVLFSLQDGDWSAIATPPSGNISFMQVTDEGEHSEEASLQVQVLFAQGLLGADAKRQYAENLLAKIQEKGAYEIRAEVPSSEEPSVES